MKCILVEDSKKVMKDSTGTIKYQAYIVLDLSNGNPYENQGGILMQFAALAMVISFLI